MSLHSRVFTSLLGFQHEAAALIQINPPRRSRAVRILKADGTLENVSIARVIGLRGLRARDFEYVAQFGEKELVIGALGCAGSGPALDEVGGQCLARVGQGCFLGCSDFVGEADDTVRGACAT